MNKEVEKKIESKYRVQVQIQQLARRATLDKSLPLWGFGLELKNTLN